MKRAIIFVVSFLALIACSTRSPKINSEGLLVENELVSLLIDLHLFEAKVNSLNTLNPATDKKIKLSQECYDSLVFAKYDCNDSIFRKSIEVYTLKGRIKGIYEKVIDSLNTLKTVVEQGEYELKPVQ